MSEPETSQPALPTQPADAPPAQHPEADDVPLSATPALNEGGEAADVVEAVAEAAAAPVEQAAVSPGVAAALNEGDDGTGVEPAAAAADAGDSAAAAPAVQTEPAEQVEPGQPGQPVDPAEPAAATAQPGQAARPAIPDLPPAATAELLAQHFPALFGAGRALPIKLRIQADIQQRVPGVFNKKSLSIFLHRATTSTAYLRALANAPHRFDLDGAPAGDIADEHRAAATVELDRRRAIVDARRQAERQAQRESQRTPRHADTTTATAAGAGGTPTPAQPPRQPRPPRPARPAQGQRPPRPAAARVDGDAAGAGGTGGADAPRPDQARRAEQEARPRGPGRPDRAAQGPRAGRPDRADRPDRPAREQRPLAPEQYRAPLPPAAAPAAPTIADPAARERATLLRQYESSPLTLANFGALKGLREAELTAQLDQAWHERQARGGAAEQGATRSAGPASRRPR